MIGILLLIIALFLYIRGNIVYSILIFISFCSNGLSIFPDFVIGVKNQDLALIYTLIITLLNIPQKHYFATKGFEKLIFVIILFLLFSSIYSYFHYHLSIFQIIQASRVHYVILAYFFLRRLAPQQCYQVFLLLQKITFITSFIYILQIVVGHPILPNAGESRIDTTTGLIRLYNFPPLLTFFLLSSFIYPQSIKRKQLFLYRSTFFLATLCTLGRTYIITNLFIVILGLYLKGGLKKSIKNILLLGIFFLPLSKVIISRFEKGDTSEDISYVLQTNPEELQYFTTGGTMTYRFAWFLERYYYLIERPFSELFFGLGFISDSQPQIMRMYQFKVGATGEVGSAGLVSTPDISWGNLLTQWGMGGMILITIFWIRLAIFFYKRKSNALLLVAFITIVGYFILSFSSGTFSKVCSLCFFFLLISIINNRPNEIYPNSNISKTS